MKSIFRACYGEPPDLTNGEAQGLVLVADGCGGLDLCAVGLRYVMGALRIPCQVRVVSWGHGFGRWYADLSDTTHLETHAAQAAHDVEEFLAGHPGAPVYLVGKSGGTAVVVKALERLPEGAVEAAVLLSSALSPSYDLTRALHAVRREVAAFWSPLDVFVLGAGTFMFGTIDRKHSVSAGLVGFRTPPEPSAEQTAQYAKLRQIRWRAAMAPTGYMGGHVGPDCPAFLRKYVVPLLSTTTGTDMLN
ncbi:MAG: alpha/beta hydrolase [Isosphaeraceae bacterium]|nr:alpha/beta hydrolase [Isosphaeraceae bacterium]